MIHHHCRNSPVSPMHSSMLCADLSRRVQNVNCNPPSSPPSTQSVTSSSSGPRASHPTAQTPIVLMLAPHRNHMTHTAIAMPPDYYASTPFMRTENLPQFSSYHHAPQRSFPPPASPYASFMPAYPQVESSFDFGGVCPELYTVQQPPPSAAVPEQPVSPIQPFNSYACRWLDGIQCDGSAPGKNREMGEHLRVFHRFIGHERDTVQCQWENCGQVMQRMNVPRHIVSRHLLAAARCRFCGKRFSRPDVVGRHERTCDGVSPSSNGTFCRV